MLPSQWRRVVSRAVRPNRSRRPLRVEYLEDRVTPAFLSYYQAEGNANDSQGANNGVLQNGVAFVPGIFGQGFSFNGLNSTSASQVTVPASPSLDFTTGTVTAWFNAPADSNNEGILAMRTSVSSAGTRWSIHVNQALGQIGIWNGTSYQTVSTTINPNVWYNLACVLTTASMQVYLNGASVGTIPVGINAACTGRPFVIGTPNDPGFTQENFAGKVDDVRVYNNALTATEIRGLYTTVFANVPEAANYQVVYQLPVTDTPNYSATIPYTVNRSAAFPAGSFDRIAYYWELQTGAGPLQYVYVSVDAFTTNASKIGVPNLPSGAVFQQFLTKMNVVSNVGGVVTGTGITTGNIEFWPYNYGTANAAGVPGANGGTYDFGDQNNGNADHGSMQIHNYGAAQTLFGFSRWNRGEVAEIGVGPNTTGIGQPDWTFNQNASTYTVKNLVVLVGTAAPSNDFGDAPATYGDAQHTAAGVRMGALRDTEAASKVSANATGDDTDNTDDEDGVTLGLFAPGGTGTATVDVQNIGGTAYLQGWVDWDNNGSFGVGEQVATDVAVTVNGSKALSFAVPGTAAAGSHIARFRISTTSGLGATGSATDGEVEDYQITVSVPTTVYVSPTFTTAGAAVDGDLTAGGVQAATVGYDAFATIGQALSVVASNGTAIINTATYAESPTVSNPLTELRSYAATVNALTANAALGLNGTFNAVSGGSFAFNNPVTLLQGVTVATLAGGAGAAAFNAAVSTSNNSSLTITAGSGGVVLGTVGTLGGGTTSVGSLTVTTPGLTQLNGTISADPSGGTGNVDFSTATGGIRLNNTVTITGDGTQGSVGGFVNLTGSTVFARDPGIQGLKVNAGGGTVTVGQVGTAANPLAFFTAYSTAGTERITLVGNIFTDTNSGTGAVTLSGLGGGVRIGATLTIDTEQGNNGNGGAVTFSGSTMSATVAGSNLTINTGSGVGTGGAVNLGPFTNTAGQFVNDVTVDTTAPTRGDVTIEANSQIAGVLTITGRTIASNATFTAGAGTTVTLTASGAITDGNGATTNFSANALAATAATGIDLDTAVALITAATTAAGAISIDELDAVTLTSVVAANGPITITAGGTVTATSVVSSTDADANDIAITAAGGGNILVGTISAGTVAGDVTLTANTGPTGSIFDDNNTATRITADVVTLTAFVDIGIAPPIVNVGTAANTIVAATTNTPNAGTHGIWIDELDAVTLQNVTTADGLIRIATGGNTLITNLVATGTGRNATVIESAGDMTVGTAKSISGNVSLTATNGNLTVNTLVSAGGNVTTTNGKNLTVSGPVTAVGTATMSFGQLNAGNTALINANITGTTAKVLGGAGVDAYTVNATASAQVLTLDGQGAGDSYTVNAGAAQLGTVAIADTGASGTDQAFVVGTAGADTYHMNNATAGARTITVGNPGIVATATYTSNLEQATLSGTGGGDTYTIDYANPALAGSGLPTQWVRVNAGAGTDLANVFGTANPDTIDINVPTAQRVTSAGENVDYTNALETLNVSGRDEAGATGDLFTLAADLFTLINVFGGTPTYPTTPGDTLQLVVLGTPDAKISNPSIPNGDLTFTAASHKMVTWQSIETVPVPLGLGGTFDMGTAGSPVQPGFRKVTIADTFAGGPFAGIYGWQTAPNEFDRTGNPYWPVLSGPLYDPSAKLLVDGHWGGPSTVTFTVAVGKTQDSFLTLFFGDTYSGYGGIQVAFDGTPQGTVDAPVNTLTAFTRRYTTNGTGFVNVTLTQPFPSTYWILNGLDVRPIGLVAPLTVARQDAAAGTTPQTADGLTVDTYVISGAQPNELLTLTSGLGTATGPAFGTFTTADQDLYLAGTQVRADSFGVVSVTLRRPTGSGPGVIRAMGAYGEATSNYNATVTDFTQTYELPTSRRIDFNDVGSPTAANFIGVDAGTTYTSTAANALGWVGASASGFDRGTANAELRDGNWGYASSPRDFQVDLKTAGTYFVTLAMGDPTAARDQMKVTATAGTILAPIDPTLVVPTGIGAPAGQSASVSFQVTTTGAGTFALRFDDAGGDPVWTVNGLEVRPTRVALAIGGPASAAADGTTVTTYTGSGAAANAILTVGSTLGTVVSLDKSGVWTGIQVQADGLGNFSFDVRSPASATAVAGTVFASAVSGVSAGTFAQSYTAAPPPSSTAFRFDFNGAAADTLAGYTGVRGSDLYDAGKGYGWQAGVNEFERASANVLAASGKLYRDGAWGIGSTPGVFTVSASIGGPSAARVYVGDSYAAYAVELQAEGTATWTALTTFANTFQTAVVSGTDANADGKFEIRIRAASPAGYWVMNGVDVADTAANLPAPTQQTTAAGAVVSARYDFGSGPVAGGFIGVAGSALAAPTPGYGWDTAVNDFDRGTASAVTVALFRDAAWGYGTAAGVFRVAIPAGKTADARAYIGDQYAGWPGIEVMAEGGAWTPAGALNKDQYVAVPISGSDANGDGWFEVRVRNSDPNGIWVLNGVDVSPVGGLPAAAP